MSTRWRHTPAKIAGQTYFSMPGRISILTPKDNFKKVSKQLILDKSVDPLTLGIYVKLITFGEKWDLNIKGLAKFLSISDERIRKAFAILEAKGFLRRTKAQDARGRFNGWDYEIGSVPFTDIPETPTSVKTDVGENRRRENRPQYRDNISKSEDIYPNQETNRESAVPRKRKPGEFIPPTVEEVRGYCFERGNKVDAEAFVAFYTSKGWKVGNVPMKDWKAAVITWEKREAQHPTSPSPSAPYRKESYVESAYRTYDKLFGTNFHEQKYGKK